MCVMKRPVVCVYMSMCLHWHATNRWRKYAVQTHLWVFVVCTALHVWAFSSLQSHNQTYRDRACHQPYGWLWFEILPGQCFFTASLYTQLSYSHMVLFIHHCLNMEISWKLLTFSRYWGFRRRLHFRQTMLFRFTFACIVSPNVNP